VALSADGNTVLIGTVNKNSFQGAAYVFTRSGSTWSQQRELTASDGTTGDAFGTSVALSADGNTALIGAAGKNSSQGAAYVFTRSGSTWSQQRELTASDGTTGDAFGTSVALSADGNTALIGAYFKNYYKNSFQGTSYVFTRSGSAWSGGQELSASGGETGDWFGFSAALTADGNTALIGAYPKNFGKGAAYVFKPKNGS
jgi:hypothetical protein